MKNIFTEHPHSVGETYLRHMWFASLFGMQMVIGGAACIIHSVFPFVFQKTGSNMLFKLMRNFIKRMPNIDESVVELGKLIEQKQVDTSKS